MAYRNDLLAPFLALPQGDKVQAEYVWIDGDGGLRSKTTTVSKKVTDIGQLRIWDFDGSSTNQAPGHDSDVYLRPAAIFKDPFRGGDNILVLAETYNNDGTPNRTNYRHHAKKVMDQAKKTLYHGSVLSKNIPSSTPTALLTDGLRAASPAPRVRIIVAPALARCLLVTSSRPTTVPAFTLV